MIEALLLLTGVVTGAAVALFVVRRRRRAESAPPTSRILFPYVGSELSVRALDAALRIARFEDATLVAAYLVPVPLTLSLDAPLPRACGAAFELQEAIEQHAQAAGIPVDARIATGRTVRHAMRQLLERERYDRLVVAAKTAHTDGLSAADVAWLLEHAPGEVAVMRPADESVLDAQHRVVQQQEQAAPQPQRMVGVHV
jgi:nucleotide-binding universal stress UspA family protein